MENKTIALIKTEKLYFMYYDFCKNKYPYRFKFNLPYMDAGKIRHLIIDFSDIIFELSKR